MRIKTRMHQLGQHEVVTEQALAGMVGQTVPYKEGGSVVSSARVLSADVEDGWIVLGLEIDEAAPSNLGLRG